MLQTFSSDGTQVNISPQTIFEFFLFYSVNLKDGFLGPSLKLVTGYIKASKQSMKNGKKQK